MEEEGNGEGVNMRMLALLAVITIFGACLQDEPGDPSSPTSTFPSRSPSVSEPPKKPSISVAEQYEGSQFGVAISYFGDEDLPRLRDDLLGTASHWAGSLLVRWYEIEPVKGEYHWEELEQYLRIVGDEINLLLELRLYNDWASVGGCTQMLAGSPLKEGHWNDLDHFLRLLVEKAGEKVKYWSIGNEMEIENFWCCPFCETEEASAEEYLALLRRASTVIRETDGDAVIILGGFTGNWRDGTNVNPEFVRHVLKNGKEYFDIVDLHLYGDPTTYEERVQWFTDTMDTYGYSKPIWSTEMGGPDIRLCFDGLSRERSLEKVLTEDECAQVFHLPEYREEYYRMHAGEVVKRYVSAFDAGVVKSFWWKLYGVKEYVHLTPELMSHIVFSKMGLVATESERGKGFTAYMKTPAYYTYGIMVEELDMFSTVERLPIENAEVFLFDVDSTPVIVMWAASGTTIDLSEYFDGSVRVRKVVTVLDDQEKPIYGEDEVFLSSEVPVGAEPVFIREVEE